VGMRFDGNEWVTRHDNGWVEIRFIPKEGKSDSYSMDHQAISDMWAESYLRKYGVKAEIVNRLCVSISPKPVGKCKICGAPLPSDEKDMPRWIEVHSVCRDVKNTVNRAIAFGWSPKQWESVYYSCEPKKAPNVQR